MSEPVAVGLVGAGPWARAVHAPMLAAGPETKLAAVWTRRAEAARALAEAHHAAAAYSFDELIDQCEAVAFAVPPDVQADLAVRAAKAGRALLLEKPIALTLPAARTLADAVEEAGVVTQLVLTKRYHPTTREFLASAAQFPAIGARACYLHGAFLTGPYATGWRLTHGALLDLGPHALDLLAAAISPITDLHAAGDPLGWLEVTCQHSNGVISQVSLSGSVALPKAQLRLDLFGPSGALTFDSTDLDHSQCWPIMRREFAEAVRTRRPHALDVRRGLLLQELIDKAARSLGAQETTGYASG